MARGELPFRIRPVRESYAANKKPPADRPADYEEKGLLFQNFNKRKEQVIKSLSNGGIE